MRHWNPRGSRGKIVPIREYARKRGRGGDRGGAGWSTVDAYGAPASKSWPSGTVTGLLMVAAVCVGTAVGFYQAQRPNPVQPGAAIEWGAVQPVRASFGSCKWGGGTNCVVDGDTFYIGGEKVRIAGIDAPETHDYRCDSELALGNRATDMLQQMLNSGAVTMTSIDRDRDVYGRLLRNVAVDGSDVGEALISEGLAREYAGGRRAWC